MLILSHAQVVLKAMFSFIYEPVLTVQSLLISLFAVGLLCLVHASWLAYYRLVLHPLSGFPGPKLAAVTLFYEFYYDVVLGGKYTFRIRQLHEEYGEYVPSFMCPYPRSKTRSKTQMIAHIAICKGKFSAH